MSVTASVNVASPRVSLPMVTLVCGFLSFFFSLLIAVPGIVIGHLARSQIKENPYRFSGAKLALSGLMMCYLSVILSLASSVYIIANPGILEVFADYIGYSLVLSER